VDEVGISTGSAHSILTEDLHMCRVVVKCVPKLLSQLCLEVARDMMEGANGDPEFLKTVITGDEMWVYEYDPETKVHQAITDCKVRYREHVNAIRTNKQNSKFAQHIR
jgi:hypothetical protein